MKLPVAVILSISSLFTRRLSGTRHSRGCTRVISSMIELMPYNVVVVNSPVDMSHNAIANSVSLHVIAKI